LPQPAISGAANPGDIDTYGEELLRGPVHEAFAEQYNQDPIAGVTIDRAPPPPVNEIPPEIRPEGDNVQWLSGYWFWDDDRSDFLWISGTWRVIPPGQRWLPGYWAESDGQHQWVSGSWVSTQQEAIEYIAQSPPESLDNGPAGIAPSDNHFWIPGCWTWTQNDYAWRPGYWSAGYSNWVWVPQRYLWTPRGYVFCNGYWDYPIARRGTLFAPFYFNQPVYARSNFFYSPRVSILASLLQSHFWVRPRYHHYYFGDFYAANYRSVGIIPWHSYHRGVGFQSRRYSFDPLFVHANLYNRSAGVNFYQQINNQYNIFVNQSDRRPSLTYRDQLQRVDRDRGRGGFNDDRFNRGPSLRDRNESVLGESIRDLAQRDPSRFTRLTTEQITRIRNEASDVPNLISLRRENETSSRGRDIGNRDRQSPGSDRQAIGRDAIRGADSLAGRLQLPPVERGRIVGERQTESDRSRPEGRYSVGRPEIGRPITDRPGNDRPEIDRPEIDRPGSARPSSDRPSLNRPSLNRPSSERPSLDRPSSERPSLDRPSSDRPAMNRPAMNRPDNDRPSLDRPGISLPSNERPSTDRPSIERPGINLPSGERPTINRPAIGLPGTRSPGTASPGTRSPSAKNPEIETPGRDIRSGSPLGGSRIGDRVPQASRPSLSQPRPTLPGIGASPTRPQIGAPSTQPQRTPGFGERSPGRLGSETPTPNPAARPSLNRSEGGGRPSVMPNIQRPTAPASRPQFTPRPSGGTRPEAGPSVRGNRGGGDSGRGRGPAGGSRGKRD
jgi:hypothetical protein